MRQLSFASTGFDRFGKTTCRAAFLAEMDAVVPWLRLYDLIGPFDPKPGSRNNSLAPTCQADQRAGRHSHKAASAVPTAKLNIWRPQSTPCSEVP